MLKFYSYSRIALISLIVILSVVMTVYCYNIEYNAAKEFEESTSEVVTEPETTNIAVTTKPSIDDKGSEYERLSDELNKALEKKNFDYEVNMLFKDTFETVYKNFNGWKKGYRNFPTREEFIMNCIINPIYDIDNVLFYENGSKEANKLLEEDNMPLAWVEYSEDYKPTIGIIAEKADTEELYIRETDIEKFLHEITHCKGRALVYDYCVGYEEVEYYFEEGMTTFTQKFATNVNDDVHGSWSIGDAGDNYEIQYQKSNCIGYLIYMNTCEKLAYLADYKNLEKVELGKLQFSELVDIIAQRYGRVETDIFFATITDMYKSYDENWCSDEVYNLAISVERMFLDFIKQDINALSSTKEAEAYKPIYDFYMRKNLPAVIDVKNDKDISRELFDIVSLDNLLSEKLTVINTEE